MSRNERNGSWHFNTYQSWSQKAFTLSLPFPSLSKRRFQGTSAKACNIMHTYVPIHNFHNINIFYRILQDCMTLNIFAFNETCIWTSIRFRAPSKCNKCSISICRVGNFKHEKAIKSCRTQTLYFMDAKIYCHQPFQIQRYLQCIKILFCD